MKKYKWIINKPYSNHSNINMMTLDFKAEIDERTT